MKHKMLAPVVAILTALAIVVPAFADGTVTISGGTLSVTPQSINFGTVTLNGTNQTALDQDVTSWVAVDPTGTGSGWHVTIAATNFSDGTHTIGVANFKAKLDNANISAGAGSNTAPTSSITAYTPLGAAQTLLSAASGAGMGTYYFIPDFSLDVAASSYAGVYTSTVTVQAVSGP